MGGNSGGAGLAGSYSGIGFSAGNAHSFGGGYSTSSGDRNISASTVQQASDAFAQHSAAQRELRSTIVIESDQSEFAKGQTRVVANHNHSHSLTMLYYEILRHYKVSTEFMRTRNTLLVDYSASRIDFNEAANIARHRRVLESVLLNQSLLKCFEAIEKFLCATFEISRKRSAMKSTGREASNVLQNIKVIVKTSIATNALAYIGVFTKNKESILCEVLSPTPASRGEDKHTLTDKANSTIVNYRQNGQTSVYLIVPTKPVVWGDVEGILIQVSAGSATSSVPWPNWEIEKLSVETEDNSVVWELTNTSAPISVPVNGQKFVEVIPFPLPPENPADKLSEEERCCLEKLKSHLSDNALYYNAAIWLTEDPNERANRFEKVVVNGVNGLGGGKSLLDLIENRPIEVFGSSVVFPSNLAIPEDQKPNWLREGEVQARAEKLITLPTRGVFGEAKLGHCNASEEIDNTRFWDWQTSPIPEQAPEIQPVSTESRNVIQKLEGSALPGSLVNIVNPSNLPDPTGLGDALKLLATANLFRDMSGRAETADLLKKLSDNSVKFAEIAEKALEAGGKGQQGGGQQGGGGQQQQRAATDASSPVASPPQQSAKSPANTSHDAIKLSESEKRKGNVTPEEHKKNVKEILGNTAGMGNTSTPGKDAFTVQLDIDGYDGLTSHRSTVRIISRGKQVGGGFDPTENSDSFLEIKCSVPEGYEGGISNTLQIEQMTEVTEGPRIGTFLTGRGPITIPEQEFSLKSYFLVRALPGVNTMEVTSGTTEEVTEETIKRLAVELGGSGELGGSASIPDIGSLNAKRILSIKGSGGVDWKNGQKHTVQAGEKVSITYYTGKLSFAYSGAQ